MLTQFRNAPVRPVTSKGSLNNKGKAVAGPSAANNGSIATPESSE